jgi:hypothetical protein
MMRRANGFVTPAEKTDLLIHAWRTALDKEIVVLEPPGLHKKVAGILKVAHEQY